MAKGEQAKGELKERMNLALQEREKQRRVATLRKDTLRKIEFLSKKAVIEHHEVYQLVRDFFKEFLERRYEFTINELRKELKKTYISSATRALITDILERLEAIEYTTVHYTRDDLVKVLHDFKEAVEQLVRVHTRGRSIISRIRSFFVKEPDTQTIIAELPVVETGDAYHVRIYTLVERCYVAMDDHNMRRARTQYHALLAEYDLLPAEQKTEYYPLIHQTYLDILNRTKMLKEQ